MESMLAHISEDAMSPPSSPVSAGDSQEAKDLTAALAMSKASSSPPTTLLQPSSETTIITGDMSTALETFSIPTPTEPPKQAAPKKKAAESVPLKVPVKVKERTISELRAEAAKSPLNERWEAVVETYGAGLPQRCVERLREEMATIMEASERQTLQGVTFQPVVDSPTMWTVRLQGFEARTALAQDLEVLARQCGIPAAIELVLEFPNSFPDVPPLVRIFQPRLQYLTLTLTQTLIGGYFSQDYST